MAVQRPYEKQHHHTEIDGKGHAKVELLADGSDAVLMMRLTHYHQSGIRGGIKSKFLSIVRQRFK